MALEEMEVAVLKSQLHEMRGNLTVVLGALEMNQPSVATTAAKALMVQFDAFGQMMTAIDRFMSQADSPG